MKGDAERIAQMHTIERGIQADPLAAHKQLGNVILKALVSGFVVGWIVALTAVWLWSR